MVLVKVWKTRMFDRIMNSKANAEVVADGSELLWKWSQKPIIATFSTWQRIWRNFCLCPDTSQEAALKSLPSGGNFKHDISLWYGVNGILRQIHKEN